MSKIICIFNNKGLGTMEIINEGNLENNGSEQEYEDDDEDDDEDEDVSDYETETTETETSETLETSEEETQQKEVKSNEKIKKKDNEGLKKSFKKKENSLKKKYLKLFKKYIKNKKNIKYFDEKYTNNEKEKIINEIEILNNNNNDSPKLFELIHSNIPIKNKSIIYKKINVLSLLSPDNSEYYKLNKWVDSVMSIPFEKYNYLPISIKDGKEKCKEYINQCKQILDDTVYGMNHSKVQFMQLISQWILNPNSVGSSIALKGPMGTGKTTLLKNGISKLLNREFALIPLGGANDGSYLEGHSYTYEGSTYGKIVDILINCKSNNPIIYFDELDKVSDSSKGEEIIGILTHLTDITQNTEFQDKYFSEITIDMSKCLFIFSYNDEDKVNKILKDRMYVIETEGYSVTDKINITRKFIIPNIENKLNQYNNIIFSDEILKYIIQKKTVNEQGVRSLKRSLEIIFNKINLYSLLGDNMSLFNEKIIKNIKLPIELTNDIIDILIPNINEIKSHNFMYL